MILVDDQLQKIVIWKHELWRLFAENVADDSS